jgi:hypothetical protein
MGQAYAPGLRVAKKTVIRKDRILPLKGEVVKKVGDKVIKDDVVAKTALPGNVTTVNVVNLLGIQASDIRNFMFVKEGESFKKGDIIAESKSFIKFLRTKVEAPISGTVEAISDVTGQVILREPPLPVEVQAYISGEVIEVVPEEGIIIETTATFIQGIFGIGGETWGQLKFAVDTPAEELNPEKLNESFKDCIVVGGSFASYEAINKAVKVGIKGLIVGGIRDEDLKKILGYDLGVAITGSEQIGITVLLTEGFGKIAIADRTYNTLKERMNEMTSISGATQIRAGVIRPEIIIPYNENSKSNLSDDNEQNALILEPGSQIRSIRPPFFGKLGTVVSLPHELQKIESETKARVLEVKFHDGTVAIIPRANVEIIAE